MVSVRLTLRLSLLSVASCLCLATDVSAKPSEVQGWKTQAQKAKPLSILLVGNSHLLMPGFMKRVRKQLRSKWRRPFRTRVIAQVGTTLTKSRRKPETRHALRSAKWDIVVLQESTTAFMTTHGRRNYMASVKWFRKFKPAQAKILLWQTWPQGARHALYHRRGVWGRWFKNPPNILNNCSRGSDGELCAQLTRTRPTSLPSAPAGWLCLQPNGPTRVIDTTRVRGG